MSNDQTEVVKHNTQPGQGPKREHQHERDTGSYLDQNPLPPPIKAVVDRLHRDAEDLIRQGQAGRRDLGAKDSATTDPGAKDREAMAKSLREFRDILAEIRMLRAPAIMVPQSRLFTSLLEWVIDGTPRLDNLVLSVPFRRLSPRDRPAKALLQFLLLLRKQLQAVGHHAGLLLPASSKKAGASLARDIGTIKDLVRPLLMRVTAGVCLLRLQQLAVGRDSGLIAHKTARIFKCIEELVKGLKVDAPAKVPPELICFLSRLRALQGSFPLPMSAMSLPKTPVQSQGGLPARRRGVFPKKYAAQEQASAPDQMPSSPTREKRVKEVLSELHERDEVFRAIIDAHFPARKGLLRPLASSHLAETTNLEEMRAQVRALEECRAAHPESWEAHVTWQSSPFPAGTGNQYRRKQNKIKSLSASEDPAKKKAVEEKRAAITAHKSVLGIVASPVHQDAVTYLEQLKEEVAYREQRLAFLQQLDQLQPPRKGLAIADVPISFKEMKPFQARGLKDRLSRQVEQLMDPARGTLSAPAVASRDGRHAPQQEGGVIEESTIIKTPRWGTGPVRSYRLADIVAKHPEFGLLDIVSKPPLDAEVFAEMEAMETALVEAGSSTGDYDPAPGVPDSRLTDAQRRAVLEQVIAHLGALKKEADTRVASCQAKLPPKGISPKTMALRLAQERLPMVERVARRLKQVVDVAKALLDAVPQRYPTTLTYRGSGVATGTTSGRTGYGYPPNNKYNFGKRPISRRHCWLTRAKVISTGLLFIGMIMCQMIGTFPGWKFPSVATLPEGTTLFLQLDYDDINVETNVHYFYATNETMLITRVEGAVFVNFTIGDGINEPGEYIASEGLKWWSIPFTQQDWGTANTSAEVFARGYMPYNITFTEELKVYMKWVAIQPVILGRGNCSIGEGQGAFDYYFNATGDIDIIINSDAEDFGPLSVKLDDEYLKEPNMAWNISADIFTLQQGAPYLELPASVEPGTHHLIFDDCGNLSFVITDQYDFDGDGLSTDKEIAHELDMGTDPFLPEIWGIHTIYQDDTSRAFDPINGTALIGGIWQRRSFQIYVPGFFTDLANYLYADAFMGKFTNFEIDDDGGINFGNETIYGYYTTDTAQTAIVGSDGMMHTGPASDFYIRDSLFLGQLGPGWATIDYWALYDPFNEPEICFRVNDIPIYVWETINKPAPETDSDGDSLADGDDYSVDNYILWEPNTIHQTILPVTNTSDLEVQFQVVRPPYDKSVSVPVEWHAGESGSLKCIVLPALRLFGSSNCSAPDYLFEGDKGFAEFWGENDIDRELITWDLVDLDRSGNPYVVNYTHPTELLPRRSEALSYYTLIYPETSDNLWEFAIRYPMDHPGFQDGVLSLWWDFCYVVLSEDWHNNSAKVLHIYDFDYDPANSSACENLTVAGIRMMGYADVNAMAASPNDYISTRALWALNQNPEMDTASEFDWDDELNDAILCNYTGTHFFEAYNYNWYDLSTWSIGDRFTYGSCDQITTIEESSFDFEDDPHNEPPAGWGTEGDCYIYDDVNHVLFYHDISSQSRSAAWRSFNGTGEGSVSFDFWPFLDTGHQSYSDIYAGLAESGSDIAGISVKRGADQVWRFYYGDVNLGEVYWMMDEFRISIDYSAWTQKVNISIDGSRVLTNGDFLVNGVPNEFISHSGQKGAWVWVWLDDIEFSLKRLDYNPKWEGGNYVEYTTLTRSTMDVLGKLAWGAKFDQSNQQFYIPYNATYDFYDVSPGEWDWGWDEIAGSYGDCSVDRYNGTHARVGKLTGLLTYGDHWYGVERSFTAVPNGTIDFWFQVDTVGDPYFTALIGGDDGSPAIELSAIDGTLYYRNSTGALIAITSVWAGAWFRASIFLNATGLVDYFDITIGGATYASARNLTFAHSADTIGYIAFKAGNGTAWFDSVGLSWDENYKGNDVLLAAIISTDSLDRQSYYTVRDVYNGTFASGSSALEGDETTLFSVSRRAYPCDYDIAQVNGIPTKVQIIRADEYTPDGYSLYDHLVITSASGACSPYQLPWVEEDANVGIIFTDLMVDETTHEINGDLEYGVPPRLDYNSYQGDISSVEKSVYQGLAIHMTYQDQHEQEVARLAIVIAVGVGVGILALFGANYKSGGKPRLDKITLALIDSNKAMIADQLSKIRSWLDNYDRALNEIWEWSLTAKDGGPLPLEFPITREVEAEALVKWHGRDLEILQYGHKGADGKMYVTITKEWGEVWHDACMGLQRGWELYDILSADPSKPYADVPLMDWYLITDEGADYLRSAQVGVHIIDAAHPNGGYVFLDGSAKDMMRTIAKVPREYQWEIERLPWEVPSSGVDVFVKAGHDDFHLVKKTEMVPFSTEVQKLVAYSFATRTRGIYSEMTVGSDFARKNYNYYGTGGYKKGDIVTAWDTTGGIVYKLKDSVYIQSPDFQYEICFINKPGFGYAGLETLSDTIIGLDALRRMAGTNGLTQDLTRLSQATNYLVCVYGYDVFGNVKPDIAPQFRVGGAWDIGMGFSGALGSCPATVLVEDWLYEWGIISNKITRSKMDPDLRFLCPRTSRAVLIGRALSNIDKLGAKGDYRLFRMTSVSYGGDFPLDIVRANSYDPIIIVVGRARNEFVSSVSDAAPAAANRARYYKVSSDILFNTFRDILCQIEVMANYIARTPLSEITTTDIVVMINAIRNWAGLYSGPNAYVLIPRNPTAAALDHFLMPGLSEVGNFASFIKRILPDKWKYTNEWKWYFAVKQAVNSPKGLGAYRYGNVLKLSNEKIAFMHQLSRIAFGIYGDPTTTNFSDKFLSRRFWVAEAMEQFIAEWDTPGVVTNAPGSVNGYIDLSPEDPLGAWYYARGYYDLTSYEPIKRTMVAAVGDYIRYADAGFWTSLGDTGSLTPLPYVFTGNFPLESRFSHISFWKFCSSHGWDFEDMNAQVPLEGGETGFWISAYNKKVIDARTSRTGSKIYTASMAGGNNYGSFMDNWNRAHLEQTFFGDDKPDLKFDKQGNILLDKETGEYGSDGFWRQISYIDPYTRKTVVVYQDNFMTARWPDAGIRYCAEYKEFGAAGAARDDSTLFWWKCKDAVTDMRLKEMVGVELEIERMEMEGASKAVYEFMDNLMRIKTLTLHDKAVHANSIWGKMKKWYDGFTNKYLTPKVQVIFQEVLLVVLDIYNDRKNIEAEMKRLQEKGWGDQEAWLAAVERYAGGWAFDVILDILIANTIQSSVYSAIVAAFGTKTTAAILAGGWLAGLASFGIGMMFSILAVTIWNLAHTAWQNMLYTHFSDLTPEIDPSIRFTEETNGSLIKHLSPEVGDTYQFVLNVNNTGYSVWGEDWLAGYPNDPWAGWPNGWVAEDPATGAGFWMQAQFALGSASGPSTWSEWRGPWNYKESGEWHDPSVNGHPLFGPTYDPFMDPLNVLWNGYYYPASGSGIHTYTYDSAVFEEALPEVWWYEQDQFACQYEEYTAFPASSRKVFLQDFRVLEGNLSSFLAATGPIEIAPSSLEMVDNISSLLDDNSFYSAWNEGGEVLSMIGSELEFSDEDDFYAFLNKTTILDNATPGYWRSDTRYVPFTEDERNNYVLLSCDNLAEFNSYMCGTLCDYLEPDTRFLDAGWRALSPDWSRLQTNGFSDTFNLYSELSDHYPNEPTDWDWKHSATTYYSSDLWRTDIGYITQDLVAEIDDKRTDQAFRVWYEFGPMTAGSVEWTSNFDPGFDLAPCDFTFGLGYTSTPGSMPTTDVLTFTTHPASFDLWGQPVGDGYISHQDQKTGTMLDEDYDYTYRIEWDGITGLCNMYVNDQEIFGGQFDFQSDQIPNCFMIYSNTTGKSNKAQGTGRCQNFNNFTIEYDGPHHYGYYAANAHAPEGTNPPYQILVPKDWIGREAELYDLRDDIQYLLEHNIPIYVDVTIEPEWDGLLSFCPGEVVDGSLSFTHYGPDDPEVKYELIAPEGFSILPKDGTALLHSIPRIDFSITARDGCVAGIYSFTLVVTFVENDTVIFAESYPFRYAWNQSYWLEMFPLPETMPWNTPLLYARMGSYGNGPTWAGVEVDGIPTDWLTTRGYYEADRMVTFAEAFTAWSNFWHLYASNGTEVSEEIFLTAWQQATADAYTVYPYPDNNYGGAIDLFVSETCGERNSFVTVDPSGGYLPEGGNGTLELSTKMAVENPVIDVYSCGNFVEGKGTWSNPGSSGVTYNSQPDPLLYIGQYAPPVDIGGITSIPISPDSASFALFPNYLGDIYGVQFWAQEGSEWGTGPRARSTLLKLYQGAGRVQVQTDVVESLKLKSNNYGCVNISDGDVLRVTLETNTTSEVKIRVLWLNLLVIELPLVAAGTAFAGKRTIEVPLPPHAQRNNIDRFDEVEITMTLNGTAHEYVKVYDVRVDRSLVLPETTAIYSVSFNEDPRDPDVLPQLWTLGGTSTPDMIVDWTLATQDTYVNASDPRVNYADSAILNITGGSSPARVAFLSRPRLPYLQANASLYLKLNNTGPEGGNVYFYSAGNFVGDWVTWRHAPERQAFCGNASVISGENIFQLNSSAYNFALQASANWTDGTTFASLDDPLSGVLPSFWINVSKVWHGDGIAYMQTDSRETLWLRSPTFTAVTLTAEDWVYLRYATNSSAGAELRLLYQGAVQQAITLSTSEDELGVMHWFYENLTVGCLVDQVEVRAALTAGQYVALDDLSFERPTVYNFTNASLYGYYEENVLLAGDIITELGGHRNVTAISNIFNEYNMPYSIGNVSANGSVEWYLYVPALPLGMNVSTINGSYPNFTLAHLASNLTLKLEGPEGYASLYVCSGWLVVVNNTGGAGEGSIGSPVTVCQLSTGWSHFSILLNGDGNYSITVDGLPVETCVLMNYSIAFNDTWSTLNVTLPGTGGALTYYLDAIGSTGLGEYVVGDNWNMTEVNGTGAFSLFMPGHWREYFITVTKNFASNPGNRKPLLRFIDSVTGTEIGRWDPSTIVEEFYDASMVNLTAFELHEYEGSEFNYTVAITNLGNTFQSFALGTTIPSGWASTSYYEFVDGVWQSENVVYLSPGEARHVCVSVHPNDYYYCPFNITAESQGNQLGLAALFDNDVEPQFVTGPISSLEWSYAQYINWTFADNYALATSWTVYLEEEYYDSGTWTSGQAIQVNMWNLLALGNESLGTHNFTIVLNDGHVSVNASHEASVEVYNLNPTKIMEPVNNTQMMWLDFGFCLNWCVWDASVFEGGYHGFDTWIYHQGDEYYENWSNGVWESDHVFSVYLSEQACMYVNGILVGIDLYDGLGGKYSCEVLVNVYNTYAEITGPGSVVAESIDGAGYNITWIIDDPNVNSELRYNVQPGMWEVFSSEGYYWGYLEGREPSMPNSNQTVSWYYNFSTMSRVIGVRDIWIRVCDGDNGYTPINHVYLNVTDQVIPSSSWAPLPYTEGAAQTFEYGTSGNYNMTWRLHDISNYYGRWQIYTNGTEVHDGKYNGTAAMQGVENLANGTSITSAGWACTAGSASHGIYNDTVIGQHAKILQVSRGADDDQFKLSTNAVSNISAECWMRVSSINTGAYFWLSSADETGYSHGLQFASDGHLHLWLPNEYDTGWGYELNQWYHFRIEWSQPTAGNYIRYFKDGVPFHWQAASTEFNFLQNCTLGVTGTGGIALYDGIAFSSEGNFTDWMSFADVGCGVWSDGTQIDRNAALLDLPAGPNNNITLVVWDGLGVSQSWVHFVDVWNSEPVVKLKSDCVNTVWENEDKTETCGYNFQQVDPPIVAIHWEVEDSSVGPAGGTFKVQYKNATSWIDVSQTFSEIANATGTWSNASPHVFFTAPKTGTTVGTYRFRIVVNDTVPNLPRVVEPAEITWATCIINSPSSISLPSDGSYYCYTSTFTITWTVTDSMMGGATYQIYRKRYGESSWTALTGNDGYGHAANSTIAQSGNTVSWTCSGDWVYVHSSSTAHSYKVVVNDGYGALSEDAVQVTASAAYNWYGNWFAQSYNGYSAVGSYYSLQECYSGTFRNQDWWGGINYAPRALCPRPSGNFWMQTGIYSWNGAFTETHLGICMYYDYNNVWFWGLLKDVYGNSFIKLEKIVNGVGYGNQWYVGGSATYLGLEWYNNQVRWSYYDGSWHNGPGFYSLEYTPGYIGTFYKEWKGWSEPDRYCYWGYMHTGISCGS